VEFVRHWTVPEFSGYVAGLARAADAALKIGKAAAAEQAFLEVASLERDFWQMTWEAPEAPEAPASVEEPAPQP
jgi:formylaminopyrimidine deformylase / aminopyrimidine aminohydrolase